MKKVVFVVLIGICFIDAGALQWPISSPDPESWTYGYLFAQQTVNGRHLGVDIILSPGTPIVAPCDGEIVISKIDGATQYNPAIGYGPYIIANYVAPSGEGRTFGFGHLSNRLEYPRKGLGYFSEGDILGYVGFDDENGLGGPHTHWLDYGALYNGVYHYYGYAPNPTNDDVDYDINGNYVGGKFTNPIGLWQLFLGTPYHRRHLSGDIIAVDTNNNGSLADETLWLVENSRRREIATEAVMKSWNRSIEQAVIVRPDELAKYPVGADLLYRPGTIVKYANTYHYIKPTISGGLERNDITLFDLLLAGFHEEKFVLGQNEDSPVLSAIPYGGSLLFPMATAMPGVVVKGSRPEIYCLKLFADGKIYRQHIYSEAVFKNRFGSYYPGISEVDYVSVSDWLLYACPPWPEPLGFGDGTIIRLTDAMTASGLTFPAQTGFMVSENRLHRLEPDLETRIGFMGYNPATVVDVASAQVWPRTVADSITDGNATFEIAGGSGGGSSVPSSIQILLAQTVWRVLTSSEETGNYVSARVFDQYGNEMAGERVLFVSDSVFPNYVLTVDADWGSCIAWSLGQAQVWAELYANREIRSERISVSVVESLPETPPPPVILPEAAGLRITDGLRPRSYPLRWVAGCAPSAAGGLKNVSDQPITFVGPAMLLFRVSDGAWLDFGSYPVAPKTWAPGQGIGPDYYLGSCYIWNPGDYYLALGVKINDQWQIVSQTEDGGQNKLYFHVIDPAEVKAELQKHSFVCLFGQPAENDDLLMRTWVKNVGDLAITAPFEVVVSLAGGQSQAKTIMSLDKDGYARLDYNFGKLAAGTYKFDLFIDSGGDVSEYNEADNIDSILVEVIPLPDVNLVVEQITAVPANPTTEDGLRLDYVVRNTGTADAPACQIQLLADDAVKLFQILEVPALAAGQIWTTSAEVAPFPAGPHWFNGWIDCNNVAAETNETDNETRLELCVVMPQPDWVLVSLAPKKPEFVGELAEFDITVSNQGLAPSIPCRFGLFLADGTPLGEAEIPGLEVGEFYDFSLICQSVLPEGTSLVFGKIDSTEIVAETDEGDNSLSCEVRSSSLPLPLIHLPFGCRGEEKSSEGE